MIKNRICKLFGILLCTQLYAMQESNPLARTQLMTCNEIYYHIQHSTISKSEGVTFEQIAKQEVHIPTLKNTALLPKQIKQKNSQMTSLEYGDYDKSYDCKKCGKSYTQTGNLKRHLRAHAGYRYFCKTCGNSYTRKDNLKRHQKEAHSEKKRKLKNETINSRLCTQNLKRHSPNCTKQKSELKHILAQIPQSGALLVCKWCGATFSTTAKAEFKDHKSAAWCSFSICSHYDGMHD